MDYYITFIYRDGSRENAIYTDYTSFEVYTDMFRDNAHRVTVNGRSARIYEVA